jgi:hypothetical protein
VSTSAIQKSFLALNLLYRTPEKSEQANQLRFNLQQDTCQPPGVFVHNALELSVEAHPKANGFVHDFCVWDGAAFGQFVQNVFTRVVHHFWLQPLVMAIPAGPNLNMGLWSDPVVVAKPGIPVNPYHAVLSFPLPPSTTARSLSFLQEQVYNELASIPKAHP